MLRFLLRGDTWAIQQLQTLYLYLLDRFGLRIGTFRILTYAPVILGLAGDIASDVRAGFPFPILSAVAYCFNLWVLQRNIWRPHLAENRQQDAGRIKYLNMVSIAMAIQWERRFGALLILFALFTTMFVTLGQVSPLSVGYIVALPIWVYAQTVLVRERDKSRFEKPVLNGVLSAA